MGQKVSPHGLRVGVIQDWDSKWYASKQNFADYLVEDNGSIDKNDAEKIREALPDYYRNHLNKDLFAYVVRDEKTIVSYAFLLVIEKPMSPAFINGKTGTILNVFTRESYRRKGYAHKIMDVLLAEAKAMGLVVIDLKSTEDRGIGSTVKCARFGCRLTYKSDKDRGNI